jgi:glycosyltransferase involved in cell wall biosynthesis
MPRFSIVLPCFNAESTLAETLEGLRAQTCPDWEAICVDDGSTDGTRALLADHAARDPRIRPITHAGKGPSAARNAGVRDHARGDIIAFCDADDLWAPEKLERVARTLERTGADAVYGRVAFFDGDRSAPMRRSTVPANALTIPMLLAENPVCTLSNLTILRRAFLDTGGFDEGFVHNEDLDFLIRLVGRGATVVGDAAAHVLYRANPGGLSSDLDRMRTGRTAALATAARFGVRPDARAEAIYARYLARRALRLDAGSGIALRYTLQGLAESPAAFLFPLRRGAATAVASLAAPVLPGALRRALFAAH